MNLHPCLLLPPVIPLKTMLALTSKNVDLKEQQASVPLWMVLNLVTGLFPFCPKQVICGALWNHMNSLRSFHLRLQHPPIFLRSSYFSRVTKWWCSNSVKWGCAEFQRVQDKHCMIIGTPCETRLLRLCKLLTVPSLRKGEGLGREENSFLKRLLLGTPRGWKTPFHSLPEKPKNLVSRDRKQGEYLCVDSGSVYS